MPENYEFSGEIPERVSAFEDFLNTAAETEAGLTIGDLDNMFQVLYFRYRSVYTTETMHKRLHALMAQGEHMLVEPGFLVDENGTDTSAILRENFADMPDEEYHKMLNEQYTDVTDEALEALLDQEDE